jgi:hypothetical protein
LAIACYKGQEPTRDATLDYQKRHLGRIDGETVLAELSSVPAKHNGVPVPLRWEFLGKRIDTLHQRMTDCAPEFVVFYSSDPRYRKAWDAIAKRPLTPDLPVMVGHTACLVTSHPNRERSKLYWSDMARKLRDLPR